MPLSLSGYLKARGAHFITRRDEKENNILEIITEEKKFTLYDDPLTTLQTDIENQLIKGYPLAISGVSNRHPGIGYDKLVERARDIMALLKQEIPANEAELFDQAELTWVAIRGKLFGDSPVSLAEFQEGEDLMISVETKEEAEEVEQRFPAARLMDHNLYSLVGCCPSDDLFEEVVEHLRTYMDRPRLEKQPKPEVKIAEPRTEKRAEPEQLAPGEFDVKTFFDDYFKEDLSNCEEWPKAKLHKLYYPEDPKWSKRLATKVAAMFPQEKLPVREMIMVAKANFERAGMIPASKVKEPIPLICGQVIRLRGAFEYDGCDLEKK